MRNDVLKAVGGFSVALLVIGLFTWLVGWQDIISSFARASTPILLVGGFIAFVGFLAVGVAWWIMVRHITGYSLAKGLWVFLATQFANSVTPLGQLGGEPFIAYILSRDSDTSIGHSFGAVLAADVMNTVPFFTLSLLGILIFLVYFPLGETVSLILMAVLVLVVLMAAGLLALWRYRSTTLGMLESLGSWLSDVFDSLGIDGGKVSRVDGDYMREKGRNFYAVFGELVREKRLVSSALVASHVAALLGVLAMYLIILSMGHDAPLSAILFVLPASMLAGYLPLPGGLGGIELAMTVLLNAVAQVPLPVASAAALLYRLFTYWLGMMLLGGLAASRLSVDIFSQ